MWPEGNENRSGGSTFDQQCGSIWHGRGRWLSLFNALNTKIPMIEAHPAAPTAENLCGPPSISSMTPSPYHSQPSPIRVARSIHRRNHRGARHRFIRLITRWSRRSMKPQRVLATAMVLAHLAPVYPEAGIHVPKHAMPFLTAFKSRRPLLAKAHLVKPVPCRKCGDQRRERHKRKSPRLFRPH